MRLALLGPVLVEDANGESFAPASALGRVFLVALALVPSSGRSATALAQDLWDDDLPANPRGALQTVVSRLRGVLAPGLIVSTAAGYRLATADTDCHGSDLDCLEELARGIASRTPGSSVEQEPTLETIDRVLGLVRGTAGDDLPEGRVRRELVDRVEAAMATVRRERAELLAAAGHHAEAILELERLVRDVPFNDLLRLQLMRAYARAGRPTDATRLFTDYRLLLRETLGTDPSPEITAAHTAILTAKTAVPTGETKAVETSAAAAPSAAQQHPTNAVATASSEAGQRAPSVGDRRSAAAGPSWQAIHVGVRRSINALIGRDHDVTAIERMLDESRLVTILGPGGLGKTRLAQEVAGRALDDTPVVVVVEFASIRDGDDVGLLLAAGLGIREARTRKITDPIERFDLLSRIIEVIGDRRALLVFDNCEHVIEASARWADDLTAGARGIRILATSRSPLAVNGEGVHHLEPLSSASGSAGATGKSAGQSSNAAGAGRTAVATAPAVVLFSERARAARADVILDDVVVARLCDRLDGLPLAIELAAARVRSLAVDEIERRLSNRFVLLRTSDRTAPARHQTLLAVIEWSWQLLSSDEQKLWLALCRFSDGFSLETAGWMMAAARVDGAALSDVEPTAEDSASVLELLDGLVDQSIVSVSQDQTTGAVRYRMLETVREFGDRRLRDLAAENSRDGATDAGSASATVDRSMAEWAIRIALIGIGGTQGESQRRALDLMAAEEENLVAQLRDALATGRQPEIAAIFAVLSYFWSLRGAHNEVFGFGRPVLDSLHGYRPSDRLVELTIVTNVVLAVNLSVVDADGVPRAIAAVRKLLKERTVSDHRIATMARLSLAIGDDSDLQAELTRARSDSDPRARLLALLISAQYAENAADPEGARAYSESSFLLAEELDDVWGQAMSAQGLANLESQLAHPEATARWASIAEKGLRKLGAKGDLEQLIWFSSYSLVALGELDEAERRFAELSPAADGWESDVVAASRLGGLAEVALARAERDSDRDEWRRALAQLRTAIEAHWEYAPRMRPDLMLVATVGLVAHCRDIDRYQTPDSIDFANRLGRRLVDVVLARSRDQSIMVDRPVLGTLAIGFSYWVLSTADDLARGGELFALGEGLASRQDPPSLYRSRLLDRLRELHSATTEPLDADHDADRSIDSARARVRDLTMNERVERLFTLLAMPPLRGVMGTPPQATGVSE